MRLANFRDVEIEVRKLWNSLSDTKIQEKVIETKVVETTRIEAVDSIQQGNSVLHRLKHVFRNVVEIEALELVTSANPTVTDVVTLGTSSLRFKELYLKDWNILADIVPKVNENVDIGSSTYRVRKVYLKDLYISSTTASKPLLVDSGKNVISRAIDLSSLEVSNTLAVSNGGTGKSSLTTDSVMLGNGTSAVQLLAGVSDTHSVISSIGVSTYSLQYKDHAGTNQTLSVVTNVNVVAWRSYDFSKGVLIATGIV